MKIKLFANLRDIAGKSELQREISESMLLKNILIDLSNQYGNEMRELLFDSETSQISNNIMIFVNGNQVDKNQQVQLFNQDEMAILLPLAGG